MLPTSYTFRMIAASCSLCLTDANPYTREAFFRHIMSRCRRRPASAPQPAETQDDWKRRPFALRKAAFYVAKRRLPHRGKRHTDKSDDAYEKREYARRRYEHGQHAEHPRHNVAHLAPVLLRTETLVLEHFRFVGTVIINFPHWLLYFVGFNIYFNHRL